MTIALMFRLGVDNIGLLITELIWSSLMYPYTPPIQAMVLKIADTQSSGIPTCNFLYYEHYSYNS